MIQASYAGEIQTDNSKGILFKLAFTGVYGVNGTGDLVSLAPASTANPNGVLDPLLAYNILLTQTPKNVGVFSENLSGSYIQPAPNAVPTINNLGIRMFEPNGTEKATGAAYTAAELAGSATLLVFIPLQ